VVIPLSPTYPLHHKKFEKPVATTVLPALTAYRNLQTVLNGFAWLSVWVFRDKCMNYSD